MLPARTSAILVHMSVAEETAALVSSLPSEKANAVLEFARYLAERADELEWEKRLNNPPKRFVDRMAEVTREIAAGKAKPMDTDQL